MSQSSLQRNERTPFVVKHKICILDDTQWLLVPAGSAGSYSFSKILVGVLQFILTRYVGDMRILSHSHALFHGAGNAI